MVATERVGGHFDNSGVKHIVEGTGGTTSVILMPSSGTDTAEFSYPAAIIAGRLDINAAEIEPADAGEVKQVTIVVALPRWRALHGLVDRLREDGAAELA